MPDEYIRRDFALAGTELYKYGEMEIEAVCAEYIQRLPAADVAEVVRCKDCRWRGREECAMFYRCECGAQNTWETDNDFCSYGERR